MKSTCFSTAVAAALVSSRVSIAHSRIVSLALFSATMLASAPASAATLTADVGTSGRQQRIDGFGTCVSSAPDAKQAWFQQLYYDDLRSSILRVDVTPRYKSPYSDWSYNSPWFHNNPPLPGPENNNVRTYTGPNDYSRLYAGKSAPIAIMGPDIETNIAVFDYDADLAHPGGVLAQVGTGKSAALGGFKLLGCFWSPAPWVKVATGNTAPTYGGILPAGGTPWPFIWFDNFAGGKLDISNEPLDVFHDGTGPTSAMTQYARSSAAYLLGYQRRFGVRFDLISVQNEPGFEQFFNSATYKLSHEYIAALKALRAEFDRHAELRHIRFQGFDDLLGGDPYSLWQFGGGTTTNHKNLQYLAHVEADPVAREYLSVYSIHGYASDGVNAASADPRLWRWWAEGWAESPAPGIPANISGFLQTGKKSWMTETSGEDPQWLSPASGFPNRGAWSVALRIHQALTVGRQSAWLYWQLSDGDPNAKGETLSGSEDLDSAPKYNAAKHYFRHIRPGAQAVTVATADPALAASAYVHDEDQTLTYVVLNTSSSPVTFDATPPSLPTGIASFDVFTSSEGIYWSESIAPVTNGRATVTIPGYGVATLVGRGTSISLFADSLRASWALSGPVAATTAGAHWSSERALRFTASQKHTAFQLKSSAGVSLTPNDLLQFYVRVESGTPSIKRIQITLGGNKTLTTIDADIYVDGDPVATQHIAVPADGSWHSIAIDLSSIELSPNLPATFRGLVVEADGPQVLVIDDIVVRSL